MASHDSVPEPAYEDALRKAKASDLSIVERSNTVIIARNEDGTLAEDGEGNAVVMLMPAMIPRESSAWEKAFLLFLRETELVS